MQSVGISFFTDLLLLEPAKAVLFAAIAYVVFHKERERLQHHFDEIKRRRAERNKNKPPSQSAMMMVSTFFAKVKHAIKPDVIADRWHARADSHKRKATAAHAHAKEQQMLTLKSKVKEQKEMRRLKTKLAFTEESQHVQQERNQSPTASSFSEVHDPMHVHLHEREHINHVVKLGGYHQAVMVQAHADHTDKQRQKLQKQLTRRATMKKSLKKGNVLSEAEVVTGLNALNMGVEWEDLEERSDVEEEGGEEGGLEPNVNECESEKEGEKEEGESEVGLERSHSLRTYSFSHDVNESDEHEHEHETSVSISHSHYHSQSNSHSHS